jgi:hypothetical protein
MLVALVGLLLLLSKLDTSFLTNDFSTILSDRVEIAKLVCYCTPLDPCLCVGKEERLGGKASRNVNRVLLLLGFTASLKYFYR